MIKAVPYIQTIGSEKFKQFLTQPFSFDFLFTHKNNEHTLFEGWKWKDMGNWQRFTNEDKVVLEFYPDVSYSIKKPTTSGNHWQLPIPKTLNDFINDMDRVEVPIYWSEKVDQDFEPKEYLHAEEISKYFTHLLIRMGKTDDIS